MWSLEAAEGPDGDYGFPNQGKGTEASLVKLQNKTPRG